MPWLKCDVYEGVGRDRWLIRLKAQYLYGLSNYQLFDAVGNGSVRYQEVPCDTCNYGRELVLNEKDLHSLKLFNEGKYTPRMLQSDQCPFSFEQLLLRSHKSKSLPSIEYQYSGGNGAHFYWDEYQLDRLLWDDHINKR